MVDAGAGRQPQAAQLRGLRSTGADGAESRPADGLRTAPRIALVGPATATRVPELAALLGEVDQLRRDLRADLALAATAAAAGEPELAAFLLHPAEAGSPDRLDTFEQRALAHLHRLEHNEQVAAAPAPRPARRLLPATPLVAAAAALFGFLSGVGHDHLSGEPARAHHSTWTNVNTWNI